MNKKILSIFILSLIIFSSFFLFSNEAKAVGLPFGGYVTMIIPCTCSGNMWVFMSPMFISDVSSAGALVYQPGAAIPYDYFITPPVPTTWLLGDYIPGAGQCWMYAGTSCFTLPAIGMIQSYGSSMPGSSI
ncbi:MAG: hypothetical protein WCP15_00395 [bacterium]